MFFFFFSSRRRHTRCGRDWSSDVCSSDLSRLSGSTAKKGNCGYDFASSGYRSGRESEDRIDYEFAIGGYEQGDAGCREKMVVQARQSQHSTNPEVCASMRCPVCLNPVTEP